ncbi:MAG: hypothetical protein VW397_01775 [Candidatus Margulisiibacteriota bacterium]
MTDFFKAKPSQLKVPSTILIIRWDRIGDAVLSLPIIDGLKHAFPKAKIDVVCSLTNQQVFDANPNINRIIALPGYARSYGLQRIFDTIKALFEKDKKMLIKHCLPHHNYDLGIDLVAGEWTQWFKPYCKYFVGPKSEQGGSWVFNSTPSIPLRYSEQSYAEYFLTFLSKLYQKKLPTIFPAPLPRNKSKRVSNYMANLNHPFILMYIGGSEDYRSFSHTQLNTLLPELAQYHRVAIFDNPDGKNMTAVKSLLNKNIIALEELSLPELAEIASNASLFIGIEGGPTHYLSNECNSLILFSSKFHKFLFQNWLPPLGPFSLQDTNYSNAQLYLSKHTSHRYGALVQIPKKRYRIKPYYIDLDPLSISNQAITNAITLLI